jgi:hypothetical protein
MQCERAEELFSDYIEGALDPAMRQVFEQHLSVCASCNIDVEQLRAVFGLLDEGLPEVATPPGFRAAVLNKIRQQPHRQTLLERMRAWITPNAAGRITGAPAIGVTAAALLVAIASGTFLSHHNVVHPPTPTGVSMGSFTPWAKTVVPVRDTDGIVQGVQSYNSADGKTYHVFGLHLPAGEPSVNATAYIVQSQDAFNSDAALQNDANATKVWSGAVDPGEGVQVPVAVVSNVPAGTSMTFLAEWTDQTGEHREACILPISPAADAMVVNAGEPLYQALETVAVAFNTPILLNDVAVSDLNQPITQGLDHTDQTISDSLADLVLPDNLNFNLKSDGSVVVDG